jgi:hypothetical protein
MCRKAGILIFILTGSFFFASCSLRKPSVTSVTTIKPLGDTMKVNDGSLIYALPMTVFNITVEFQHTIEKPGPYARYATDMLGIKDIISRESEKWAISKIGITSSEELDPSEFYVIETNVIAMANALELKKYGLILDINPAVYETGRMIPVSNAGGRAMIAFNDLGSDEYFLSQNDTAYRVVKLDTSFVRIPYLVERKKSLNTEQLADKAAKALLELRDGKQFILTGEANVFPQSSAGIDEINRLEREYTALFAGKSVTETRTLTYTLVPDKENAGKQYTLFRFSESAGPSAASSSAGTPVVAELIPAGKIKDITIITRPAEEGKSIQTFDKLYYRIPEVVTLKVSSAGKSYVETRKLVYQLGQVVQLPANYIIGK